MDEKTSMIQQYVDFEKRKEAIELLVKQYKDIKYQELYKNVGCNLKLSQFYRIEERLNNYSNIYMLFILASVLLIPVIIALTCMSSYENLNLKFMFIIGVAGLICLFLAIGLKTKNDKLYKIYKKIKKGKNK